MHQQQPAQWQVHHQPQAIPSHFVDTRANIQRSQPKQYVQPELETTDVVKHSLSATEVGVAFTVQYFKIMKNRPEDLPRFYTSNCRVTRCTVQPNGSLISHSVSTPDQVEELLMNEHGRGVNLSVAIINVIECQDSTGGSVFIHLTGILKYVDETSKNFTMSIVLGREENNDGYFIFNDCLVSSQPTESDIARVQCNTNTHMQHTVPIPANAPLAATGQPSAAPLPTTTAPRLSGNISPLPVHDGQTSGEETDFVSEPKIEESNSTTAVSAIHKSSLVPETKSDWHVIDNAAIEDKELKTSSNPIDETFDQYQDQSEEPRVPNVIESNNYSKNSYAGVLVKSGSLQTARVGYSIPKPSSNMNQQSNRQSVGNSEKSKQRGSFGRGKTLWVSVLPTDMSDERLKKAISDQLKGQATEGHVVRIERVPRHVYGYIELDTEACAKLLLERGLHLQGREVTVNLPSKSANRSNKSTNKFTDSQYPKKKFEKSNIEPIEEGWTNASRRRTKRPVENIKKPVNQKKNRIPNITENVIESVAQAVN